jgi:hypothetical protein
MTSQDAIMEALRERGGQDGALADAVRAYFGRGLQASMGSPSSAQHGAGLRLLNLLSQAPSRTEAPSTLFEDLVELAFERPELRPHLLPLLTHVAPPE